MKEFSAESKWTGVIYAALAAALFGASTPFAKLLLGETAPVLLAALLYLGSGIGLSSWLALTWKFGAKTKEASLKKADVPWLAGAILAGGIVAPIMLLFGLNLTAASTASLLLNLEGVLTAVLAWFVFKENFDRRIAFGMAFITVGGIILSWAGKPEIGLPWGALLISGACLMWAIDNNLTRRVSTVNPLQIAALKGVFAGTVNLIIALAIGAKFPGGFSIGSAAFVGLLGYGISLSFFVLALRHIGTARTGAYFSLAPFVGALISIVFLGDSLSVSFLIAAALMGVGVYFHLTENHEHEHAHSPLEHEHRHRHDEHHRHEHPPNVTPNDPHSHAHNHDEKNHAHEHFPDIHHQH
jgi:drug/metabolite transporter (DMT)-like permease